MSSTADVNTLVGSCHCRQIRLEFTINQASTSLTPRACDCAFCRKHGAAYISSPDGRLSIFVDQSAALTRYHHGSNNAQFLLCARCGVLTAVIYEHRDVLYGAVNSGCLDGPMALGTPVLASPQVLSPEKKISRWLEMWVPGVQLIVAGA
jgi:hypothetical protein